jgi:hypothetical protein
MIDHLHRFAHEAGRRQKTPLITTRGLVASVALAVRSAGPLLIWQMVGVSFTCATW